MRKMRKRAVGLSAVAAAAALVLAACGGGTTGGPSGQSTGAATKGGTLYYLQYSPAEHLDPQRMYIGRDLANMGRTVYRSLVAFPSSTDPNVANKPVPDLATDTGTPNSDASQWSFTLKDGVKWEDGKPVTCEDLKYGVSRTFATDVITGGPNYILGYLDIPTDPKTGLPAYNGPYKGDGQQLFDKAVTCQGNTITYRFNKPWPDFPLAIASLRAFDPYRQDKDQGPKSDLQIFSNGPYKLEGSWSLNKGGTLVRNDQYDPKTDNPDLRQANPDKIVFSIGDAVETIADRLIADSGNDQFAVTPNSIPPSYYSQITGPVADRATLVDSPFVSYALPNFNRITNPKVRQALAAATDQVAYNAALGGEKAGVPALSLVNPAVPGYQENSAFQDSASGGNADAAKQLLQQSGEQTPYPIKYTYPGGTPTSDKSAAALKAGWEKAGFKVTLDPLTDTYYTVIQQPTSTSDVIWGGWGADWPSISTVIPPLFDSRINLTENSNGQDYGNYKSDQVNSMIDQALNQTDLTKQAEIFAQIDAQLAKDVAYIPLSVTKFYELRGSKIENYMTSISTNGYPDLGPISLAGGGS